MAEAQDTFYKDIPLQSNNAAGTAIEKASIDKCYVEWQLRKKKADAQKKYKDAQKAGRKWKEMLKSTKIGTFFDALAGEGVAAVGFLASQLAAAALGAVSGMANKILETIFNQLLKIIMAGPEAIFALVKFPQDKAKLHTLREEQYMISAQQCMAVVIRILNKYLNGFDSDQYYRSMKKALPHINNAIAGLDQLIKELNLTTNDSPYFDTNKFNYIMSEIDTAVNMTIPKSILIQKLGIDKAMEKGKQEERAAADAKNKEWYDRKKRELDATYRTMLNDLRKQLSDQKKAEANKRSDRDAQKGREKGVSLKGVTDTFDNVGDQFKGEGAEIDLNRRISGIDAEYQTKLEGLKRDYDFQVQKDRSAADFRAMDPTSSRHQKIVSDTANKTKQEFLDDMDNLGGNLKKMLLDIKDAFIEYKMSQFFTGVTHDSVDLIKKYVIGYLIQLAHKAAKLSATGASYPLNGANSILQDVSSDFAQDIDKWNKGEIKPYKMATDMSIGNIQLQAADALLAGTITTSLIAMMNFDKFLQSETDRFNAFKLRIEDIPDFKGIKGIWGVNDAAALANVTTYTDLLAQIAFTITVVPGKMLSQDKQDKKDLQKVLYTLDSKFTIIRSHNQLVYRTLSSYTPYQSGMVNQLKRLIDSMIPYLAYGMAALSIAQMVKGILNGMDLDKECSPMWDTWDKKDPSSSGDPTTPKTSDSQNSDASAAATGVSKEQMEAGEDNTYNEVDQNEGAASGPVPSSMGIWSDERDYDRALRKSNYDSE
jgi:hypothetical protein